MNYDLFLMHKVLIDRGVHVNSNGAFWILFESLPYDEQYDIMPELFADFEKSECNVQSLDLLNCLKNYVMDSKDQLSYGSKTFELKVELNEKEYWLLCSAVSRGEFSSHKCGETIYKITNAIIKEESNA